MNIAEYIAYLIGDSERRIIPAYEDINFSTVLYEGNNPMTFNLPNALISEVNHPEGVVTISGEGIAAVLNPTLGWVGSLSHFSPISGYWVKSDSHYDLSIEGVRITELENPLYE